MKSPGTRLWIIVICLLAIVYCAIEATGAGDLLIFLSAARDLDGHSDIYNISYFDGFHYYYSVLFALVLRPLVFLPYYGVKLAWLILNLTLYCHLFFLLSQLPAIRNLISKKRNIFLFCVFLFSFRFLHENIHASQITIVILWCTIIGMKLINSGNHVIGALLLVAGISIKLLPIVFIPYLIYRGQFRATLFVVIFYFLMMILPSFFVGHDYNLVLLKSWWSRVNPANSQHVLDVDERSFHGLSTLLSTLLVKNVPDPLALPLKRNIMDISEHALFIVLTIARGVIALATLFFLRWPPFIAARLPWQKYTEVSYLLLVIPLIFPHQQHYAFIFAVPAFACVCYYLIENYGVISAQRRTVLTSLLILVYFCGNLRTVLGEFNWLYEHYKILTYGALLLIPALMFVSLKSFKDPLQV